MQHAFHCRRRIDDPNTTRTTSRQMVLLPEVCRGPIKMQESIQIERYIQYNANYESEFL